MIKCGLCSFGFVAFGAFRCFIYFLVLCHKQLCSDIICGSSHTGNITIVIYGLHNEYCASQIIIGQLFICQGGLGGGGRVTGD